MHRNFSVDFNESDESSVVELLRKKAYLFHATESELARLSKIDMFPIESFVRYHVFTHNGKACGFTVSLEYFHDSKIDGKRKCYGRYMSYEFDHPSVRYEYIIQDVSTMEYTYKDVRYKDWIVPSPSTISDKVHRMLYS